MKKRAIIVHGWEGSPEEPWLKWLAEHLRAHDYAVTAPAMPHPDTPTIDDWVSFLRTAVGSVDEQTIFVGHSIGCQTILRYLASLPADQKVGTVILVAPFVELTGLQTPEERAIAAPWLETPLDWDAIRTHTTRVVAIFSDNDPFVPLLNRPIFHDHLRAEIVTLQNMGHFDPASNVTELPVVLEQLVG